MQYALCHALSWKDSSFIFYMHKGLFSFLVYYFQPVAFELGIPAQNIRANQLLFGTSGESTGFDPAEPTSRSGGKAVAVQQIRQVWCNCGFHLKIIILVP